MKYCVTVTRTGWTFVEANSEEEAMYIANHQRTEDINWSDDWSPTDIEEDDSLPDGAYTTECAFK